MINIRLYSAMDLLCVEVTCVPARRTAPARALRPHLLHREWYPLGTSPNSESIRKTIDRALEHIDGYAGDLMDHVLDDCSP